MDFVTEIIIMFFSLTFILLLIYTSSKLYSSNLSKMQGKKYVEVVEKTQISKDTYILVIKTGSVGVVIITTKNSTNVIKNLDEGELLLILENKSSNKLELNRKLNSLIKNKIFNKKEEGNYE